MSAATIFLEAGAMVLVEKGKARTLTEGLEMLFTRDPSLRRDYEAEQATKGAERFTLDERPRAPIAKADTKAGSALYTELMRRTEAEVAKRQVPRDHALAEVLAQHPELYERYRAE